MKGGRTQTPGVDITDVGFVKRIVVGNTDPERLKDDNAIQRQMEELNRCLTGFPKGKIIAMERNFYILQIAEHQVVMQNVAYHVGFRRKPSWAGDMANGAPSPKTPQPPPPRDEKPEALDVEIIEEISPDETEA